MPIADLGIYRPYAPFEKPPRLWHRPQTWNNMLTLSAIENLCYAAKLQNNVINNT